MVGGAELGVRISYEWLGDFVDLEGVTPKEAADVLTRLGVEVESLTQVDLSQIVIGRVLEQKPHPKSRNPLGSTRSISAGERSRSSPALRTRSPARSSPLPYLVPRCPTARSSGI